MKPARLILLVVALVAGGLAAVFALNRSPSSGPEQVAAPAQEKVTKVLVASETIGVGTRVKPQMLSWQEWPENALRSEFITDQNLPDAPSQLANAVARFEIFVGEPVRFAKLIQSNSGYLSAVIAPGMRGVSVEVDATSGAGGFIVPNDHVDVIVTMRTGGVSQTILSNVRVIALGNRLGEKGETGQNVDGETNFEKETVATLELTPSQAEALVNASKIGEISLALRSVVDFAKGGPSNPNNSTVQLIRAGETFVTQISAPDTEEPNDGQEASMQPIIFAPQNANQVATPVISSSSSGSGTPPVLE